MQSQTEIETRVVAKPLESAKASEAELARKDPADAEGKKILEAKPAATGEPQ